MPRYELSNWERYRYWVSNLLNSGWSLTNEFKCELKKVFLKCYRQDSMPLINTNRWNEFINENYLSTSINASFLNGLIS